MKTIPAFAFLAVVLTGGAAYAHGSHMSYNIGSQTSVRMDTTNGSDRMNGSHTPSNLGRESTVSLDSTIGYDHLNGSHMLYDIRRDTSLRVNPTIGSINVNVPRGETRDHMMGDHHVRRVEARRLRFREIKRLERQLAVLDRNP